MIKNGAIFIIISGALWGTTGIYSHLYRGYGIPPVTMSILRVFCAMLVITPFMIKKGRKSFVLSKRGFIIACIQGVITQAVFNVAYFTAIGKLGMASSVVLIYTSPIIVAIMSYFFFKETPTMRKVFAMCVTIMGVTFTATGGVFEISKLSLSGILMGLISGICFASLAITSRLGGQSDDPMAMTYYTMVFGFIALIIYGAIVGIGEFHVDEKLVVISIINGATSVALPYFLYGFSISKLKHVSYAPILSSVENIAATLFGTFIFGEALGPWRVVGIILVMTSVVMINMPERTKNLINVVDCE
ncbi:DMT family transporter [Mogibacterium pumilum]|uniref:EamA domain-containing protein n=1 Tax=Mogibacterium pumilum TaxID=86332 RepID=A0A223ATE8_9FIRM|nr:DMT family transporter [Mogibacterium pumilum]ASS38244.1 hypothetical protein AXF17_07405 [Mogibacterium pumilum]